MYESGGDGGYSFIHGEDPERLREAREELPYSRDAFADSGIVQDPYGQAWDGYAETALPDEGTRGVLKMENHVHYTFDEPDMPIYGEPADSELAERVANEIAQGNVERERMLSYIDEIPNMNHIFGRETTFVHEQLERDFGIAPDRSQMVVLREQHYLRAVELGGLDLEAGVPLALTVHGVVLVKDDAERMRIHSPNILIPLGLHEGVHNRMHNERRVTVTTEYVDEETGRIKNWGSVVLLGGMVELGRSGQTMGTHWEESAAELYALRNTPTDALSHDGFTGNVSTDFAPGMPLPRLVNPGSVYPNFARTTNSLRMPLDFIASSKQRRDGFYVESHLSSIGAYGLHLLSKRLPGLYDDLLLTRSAPGVLDRVKSAVNSIKPGLYERQAARKALNGDDFNAALYEIEEALDVLDDYVG